MIKLRRFIVIAGLLIAAGLAVAASNPLDPGRADPRSRTPGTQTELWGEKHTNARQPPDKIMDAIGLGPGMVVGEVGAGRGRFTVHMAVRVGPTGKIYANDINADALATLRERAKSDRLSNIETILGRVDDPLFPKNALDMVFMILTYHHLAKPVDLLKNLLPSLKPGATVVVVDPDPVKDHDRRDGRESTTCEEIEPVAEAAGFEIARIETFLARDTIFILKVRK